MTYENLKLAWDRKIVIENALKNRDLDSEIVKRGKEMLIETKREIRNFYKQESESPERRYFDGESAGWYRIFAVTDYKSVAEAEKQHEPLTCYPDQLGRWYEVSHKFFQRSDGKVCGYACMAMNW